RDSGIHDPLHQDKQILSENLTHQDREELGPLALLERAEQKRILSEAIQLLTPRGRLFMKLYFEKGLRLEEVAGALGISVQNAYTVKHRVVQRLRSHLDSFRKTGFGV
ncbi:MAG: sigma-70 family RNA polymerase sigma factor, partial [Proteobacteria bacterium]|nr:sigma-70 family RNA polymerase sigma factor [Pseudomonadota bacterium]